MNNNEFSDWDSVEDAPEYTLIPKGDYKMLLEKVSQEPIKSGANVGKLRYNCQFTVTDDRQAGRKLFMGFMDDNDISRQQTKALALATNTVLIGTMYQVLVNSIDKNFIANVGVRKDKTGEYSDQNTIWSFKPLPVQQFQPAYTPPQQAYAPAPPIQPQQLVRPHNVPFDAVTQDNGVSWWVLRNNAWQQVG